MNTKKMSLVMLAIVCAFAVTACNKAGPAEKMGEKIDNATEKASDKIDEAYDNMAAGTATAGTAIKDSTITTSIKAAFLAEPGLKSFDINVDTIDRVVTLTGFVDTQANRDKAEEIAAAESGVMQVQNKIVVN